MQAVQLLLDHGANVNTQSSDDGSTALVAAALGGEPAAVSMLLDAGESLRHLKTWSSSPSHERMRMPMLVLLLVLLRVLVLHLCCF